MTKDILYNKAVALLKDLIATPSFSKHEEGTGDILEAFLLKEGVAAERIMHNVWAVNRYFDPSKPTILLNSHHDTVKPNPQYTKDPFVPVIEDGRLYGLGSNDAGGCLVSLIATFLYFYHQPNLTHNLVIAATAEEEITGYDGIELLLEHKNFKQQLGKNPDCAIVGEPTLMDLAVAEKGLMVLDCVASGKAGHAAREEGENAIYNAIKDIEWFRNYSFEKVSEWLGPVKMSVTVINTENRAHNMVPSDCAFVVDIRITEMYTHEKILQVVRDNVQSDVMPRSMRLRATGISIDHPLVTAGVSIGKKCYGSPTSSDKALMPFPALKCGPGNSARSHSADEYIFLHEIKEGIEGYIALLEKIIL